MNRKFKTKISRRNFLEIGALAAAGIITGGARVEYTVPTADYALINGTILTVNVNDSIASALAVRAGTIVEIGTKESINPYIGTVTRVIDLKGKTVTPGLIDSHAHLPHFGNRELRLVNLQQVATKDEIIEILAARVRKTPPGELINAWGIESLDLSFMSRRDLDDITTTHPVLAVSTTGQWGFANSYLLKVSGIDRSTPNPPGGRVEKAQNGDPTGLLIHYPALYLVRKSFPPLSEEEIAKNILYATRLYAQEGVTTVHDNFFDIAGITASKSAGVYLRQIMSGSLPVRVKIWPYMPSLREASVATQILFRSQNSRDDSPLAEMVKYKRDDSARFIKMWGGMKIAIDGAGPTAMWYRNERSLSLHSTEDLYSMVKLFHEAGQQVCIHAMGNKAVDTMLDVFEQAHKDRPREDSRHRIEHAICPQRNSLERIKRLGVTISTHPQMLYPWGDKMTGLKGQRVFPLKSYIEQGIPVAFGADPPAFSLWQPQYALWEAVARTTKGGYLFAPEEAISIQEALRIQTMGGAYSAFQEKDIGSLEKGKLADLVVWDRNFYKIPTDLIREAKAEMTMVGGRIVFEKKTKS